MNNEAPPDTNVTQIEKSVAEDSAESDIDGAGMSAESALKEIVKREAVSRIQENFRNRNIAGALVEGSESSEKKVVLEFEYLRHNLLLSKILDKVVERGILGSVKKQWRVILAGVENELSQLSPESRAAIESALAAMFENKQKIEEYLAGAKPSDIFSELIGDGKEHLPKGEVKAKTMGDILYVRLSDLSDYAKVFLRSATANKNDIGRSGGFAHKRKLEGLGKEVDVIVVFGKAANIYWSTTAHEVAHRVHARLFGKGVEQFEVGDRAKYDKPEDVLDDRYRLWIDGCLRDELWAQALSGLLHYEKSPSSDVKHVVGKYHVNAMLRPARKGGLYDYPEEVRDYILKKLKEFFPEKRRRELEALYFDYADRYYEFARHKIRFIRKQLAEIKVQWMRYDFLNLLRFEDLQKWQRVPRFLENIGKNFDVMSRKYGFDSEQAAKALDIEHWPSDKDGPFGSSLRYSYDKQSVENMANYDNKTKALLLLWWANYNSTKQARVNQV